MKLQSYAQGQWYTAPGDAKPLYHAVNGEQIAEISSAGLDVAGMLDYARRVGGPKLRKMTFHERGRMLKALAQHLNTHKEKFYELSKATGCTRSDSWIDIDGGIGTVFSYASRRREFPDETFYVEGPVEKISREGTFIGRHICVPLEGVGVHINAFNFPCWGMLEKIAPNLLAGVPAIVKPASLTAYLTELMVHSIIDSGILPEGALQLICGRTHDLFDHLTSQDIVTFTGSATTGRMLKRYPKIIDESIRFNMEADSLNCCILGNDVTPDSEEFTLFVKEVAREMTTKAGQKCTAIRRVIVPEALSEPVIEALKVRLGKYKLGDPEREGVRMGPLAGKAQVEEVLGRVEELRAESELVYGKISDFDCDGDRERGSFCPALLLYCDDPLNKMAAHDIEAFGPVATIMPYRNLDDAVELARLGKGSLVGSLFTHDANVARKVVLGSAPYHGRFAILNRDCAKESTGHGSPLAHLVHGGPGRAGGGEEMGGVRGVLHYMQRTALQGSPSMLTQVCNEWMAGADKPTTPIHPFKKYFDDLSVGETLVTHRRTITETDIVQFGCLSGDHFYAHMDKIAAADSIFGERVAHGYFIVSAAAGLFVHPGVGPVLANYGLENLRFIEPVVIGDTIQVHITVKRKTAKEKREDDTVAQGVVEWAVDVRNQDDVSVALYTILTLVARREDTIN